MFKRLRQKGLLYEKSILDSLNYYFKAHQFIRQNKFRKYLFFSGISFLLLFTLTIKAILYGISEIEMPVTNFVMPYLQNIFTLNSDDLKLGVKGAFWLLRKSVESNKDAIFSGVFFIIGTPFFSYISSKTEEILTGVKYAFRWKTFRKELKRGLSISFRNAIKQAGFFLLITLLALLPVFETFAPLFTFIVQAYYNGVLMSDYSLERHGYSVSESFAFYKLHRPEMFAIGLGFMFLLLIPVIGWFLAPTYGLVTSYLFFSSISKKQNAFNQGVN